MKCVIEGHGVKVFGKAVHALSRIGEDMWLDPMEGGLAVRSVNTSYSAYGCFQFSPLFFQHYSPEPQQDCGGTKCKLTMKSVLPLFRCLGTIERNVDRCEISINVFDSKVIFQFHCRHGITKTHNLGYQESEALQAVFPSNLCLNILKAQPKLLGDIVTNFAISQTEITLSMSPLGVNFKNYFEEESDHMQAMYTEMSLHPQEFDYFQVGVDSNITFCLRELRGLLSFAESHGLPVAVHFGASGKPVAFSVEDMVLEASVVLATLTDPASTGSSQVTAAAAHSPGPVGVGCVNESSIQEGQWEADGGGKVEPQAVQVCAPERVASSQASVHFSPGLHLRRILELQGEAGEQEPDKPRAGASGSEVSPPATPRTSEIGLLLFGAVSCDRRRGGDPEPPSLVCASDTEDDGDQDRVGIEV